MPGVFRRRWFPRVIRRGGPVRVDANPPLTGVQATAQISPFGEQLSSNLLLSGVQATTAVTTVSIRVDRDQPLTGVEATTALGQFEVGPSANLVGQEATTQIATFSLLIDSNILLVGVQAPAQVGPLVGDHPTVFLTGVSATTQTGLIVGDHPVFELPGQTATSAVGTLTESVPHGAYGLHATALVPAHPFFESPVRLLTGVKATALSWGAAGAGGGGGGAAGINGPGQRGFDGASSGDGGHGGYADAGVVPGGSSAGADGNSGNELALGYGSGSGGAGASFTSTPGITTYNYDGSITILYTSSITAAPKWITLTAADNGNPLIIPNDWTNDNALSLTGSGCATHGDVTIVGNLSAYSPGDSITFHVATYCEAVPTTWDIYSADSGAASPPVSGGKGGDAGLYGGGGGGGTGGGFGRGGDGLIFLEYVSSIDSTTKTVVLNVADNAGTPFTMPADWTDDNLVYLSGSGGNGSDGDISQGGNGGSAGSVAGRYGANVFSPGEEVPYYVSVAGSGLPTIFGPYAAASGGSASKPSIGGFGVTTLFIYVIPGTGDGIFFPYTEGGSGFGIGGLGGGGIVGFPTVTTHNLIGVSASGQTGTLALAGIPGPRTFIIAGIKQQPIAPGIVLLPTSESYALTASNYIIASSQFYTIGEVHWDGETKIQGVDWEYFAPANHPTMKHIVHILTPGTVSTNITLIFYRWDIGVRAGFKVNAWPVPFGFTGTSIVAERVPPENEYFTVEYTSTRPGNNPRTMFAMFPNMVDDVVPYHTIYDGADGFQTFRPETYKVFDEGDHNVWEWISGSWVNLGPYPDNTYFYVKRLRQILLWDGSSLILEYTAGDGSSAQDRVISDNAPRVYPLFGESIAYNFLADAFQPNAPIDYPSAAEVADNPGDYDPWVPDIDS